MTAADKPTTEPSAEVLNAFYAAVRRSCPVDLGYDDTRALAKDLAETAAGLLAADDGQPTEPSAVGTDRDTLARLIARAQDADGFYDDIEAWEDQEDWEREAHPDNYPDMAYEDRAEYEGIADRLIVMLGLLAPAPQPAADTETEVQWGVQTVEGVRGVSKVRDESDAWFIAKKFGGNPVHRTVSKTPWEEA